MEISKFQYKGTTKIRLHHPFAPGETVSLASVALEISAAQLFADVLDI